MTKTYASGDGEGNLKGIAFRGITKQLMDELLEGCQVVGFDYRYLYLNKAALNQSHKSTGELIDHTMMECFPGIENTKMFSTLRQCMENRRPKQMENEFTYPDGTKKWYELRFEPVPEGVFILSVDITPRKKAQEELKNTEAQLLHSQKLEAMGLLAAGLAHDFNNLLTIINISSELILRNMSSSNSLFGRIEQIHKAGEKAATLTSQLLAFSRQQVIEPKVLDMNIIIKNVENMIHRLIREDIRIILVLEKRLQHIKADPGQMEQILINLAVNARDAMTNGGTLTIETHNTELDKTYTGHHLEVKPGPYVLISVGDTGHGMDKETQARIFEPFFSTKEPGKGSGLGLATVFGIVKQNKGSIWVYSEPGRGSVFKVYLPVHKGEITPMETADKRITLTGTETILLVENEDEVREITAIALQMFGYTVIQASKGADAIKIFKKNKGKIQLLIVDVIMPKMGGGKVAKSILAIDPKVKILYISGYTDDAVVRQGIIEKKVAFIQKPFTPDLLAKKVRDVLDQ